MARAPFKLKSGNTPLFKQVGSSPAKQKEIYGSISASAERLGKAEEKHFLERKPTIPMEKHKGGDPNYSPKLKSDPKSKNKKRTIGTPESKIEKKMEKKGKTTNITKGDVLQTVLVPTVDLKKTIKVGEHYTKKVVKKGKELIKKDPIIKYINKGSGIIPNTFNKVKKYLKSDA